MTFRFRSSGAFVSTAFVGNWFSSDKVACNGNLVRTDRGPRTYYDTSGNTRSMTDTVVKRFHILRKEGHVFFNYMSKRDTILNPAIASANLVIFTGNAMQCGGASAYQSIYELSGFSNLDYVTSAFQLVDGKWYPPSLLSSGMIENAVEEANARCLNQRGRPDFTVLEDWAERKKTAQLAAGYGSALLQTVTKVQDAVQNRSVLKKLKALGGIASVAGSAYLMTRYGLTPVLKTVQSVHEAVKKQNAEAIRQTTRGKSKFGLAKTDSSVLPISGNHIAALVTKVTTDEVTVRATSLDDWAAQSTLERYGVDMKGLMTLPWELLTLSFVADWLVNIGDVFGSLVPSPQLHQLGGCISYTRTRSVTQTLTGYSGIGIGQVLSGGTATKTGVEVETVRFPGLRTPKLIVRNTSGNNPVLDKNWLRFADSMVLSGQALQRLVRHAG